MHDVLAARSVASLDSAALARRLGELAGDERRVQADFLLHLEVFDRQRGYLDAGYSSLWEFCQKALHLREGAAGRRIAAMRVLRRFPVLEGALREGELCLSTLGLLGPVLSEENLHEVLERAAFRTRAEVDRLVASMQPRVAPKDGIRKLVPRQTREIDSLFAFGSPPQAIGVPAVRPANSNVPLATADAPSTTTSTRPAIADVQSAPSEEAPRQPLPVVPSAQPIFGSRLEVTGAALRSESTEPSSPPAVAQADSPAPASNRARPELRPVSEESYSLRLTLDAAFKGELDQLRQLLSHKVPSGDLGAVLREAVRCAIEKHGKRRGAVSPSRKAASPSRAAATPAKESAPAKPETPDDQARARPTIPAAIRREVWARDGGRCAWRGEDGRRCESRWQLEFDHVLPVALGGPTTAANLRLACRAHNGFHAEQVFGREHMARFRRGAPREGEVTIASGGGC